MKYKQFESSWEKVLRTQMQKPYFKELETFLKKERETKRIFPEEEKVFAPFKLLSIEKINVVIVGQDPYPTYGKANGFAFAVNEGQKYPPSLKNIYKEMQADVQQEPRLLQDLWQEGVFLLNTLLTVEEGRPLSHQKRGWEIFTDAVLTHLWEDKREKVFFLWGKKALQKEALFAKKRDHLILKGAHPSPLSARNFFGCKHFSLANRFLNQKGKNVQWGKNEEHSCVCSEFFTCDALSTKG
jgi:uracil-DNA glycosylase